MTKINLKDITEEDFVALMISAAAYSSALTDSNLTNDQVAEIGNAFYEKVEPYKVGASASV